MVRHKAYGKCTRHSGHQPRRRPRSRPATKVPRLGKSAVRKWMVRFQIRAAVDSFQPFAGLLTDTLSSPAALEMAES